MVDIKVRKKSGNLQDWDPEKILLSAERNADCIGTKLTDDEKKLLIGTVESRVVKVAKDGIVRVKALRRVIEGALYSIRPDVARFYSGKLQAWDPQRAVEIAEESAESIGTTLTNDEKERLIETVESRMPKVVNGEIISVDVDILGVAIEGALFDIRPDVAWSHYRDRVGKCVGV